MYPILYQFSDTFAIKSYGVAIALAFLVGILLATWRAKKEGLKANDFLDIGFIIVISAIVGARLFYVLFNLNDYIENPGAIFKIWHGGLIFYGGLAIAVLGAMLYMKYRKIPIMYGSDIIAPSVALGYVITRIGCFLNGCCYGAETNWFTGVHGWKEGTGAAMHTGGIFFSKLFGGEALPEIIKLHPTQLYAAGINLIFFVVLFVLWSKRKFDGMIFWLYIMMYSVYRLVIEFFRADNQPLLLDLTVAQIMSVVLFICAVVAFIVGYRNGSLHKGDKLVERG
ncbi:MAG: prolipoprotein diacylglyceryl transferase [bacterium]|nr:prolipoprotein diacylglyceryl transferase [bacterium]